MDHYRSEGVVDGRVKIKLAVHRFELGTYFIHNTILFQFRPAVKRIPCDFYGICRYCSHGVVHLLHGIRPTQ